MLQVCKEDFHTSEPLMQTSLGIGYHMLQLRADVYVQGRPEEASIAA